MEEGTTKEIESITLSKTQLEGVIGELKGSILSDVEAKMAETVERRAKEFRVNGGEANEIALKKAESNKMNFDFLSALARRDNEALKSISEKRLSTDMRLKAMNETTASAGGYLVPIAFEKDVVRYQNQYGTIRKESTVIPIRTNDTRLNSLASEPTVTLVGERTALTSTTGLTFAEPKLVPKKYMAIMDWTLELEEDNDEVDLINLATERLARAINLKEETEFVDGATAGSLGLRQVTGTTTLAMAATKTIADLTWDHLFNLEKSLYGVIEGASEGSKFFMSMVAWNYLRQTKASTSGNYFVQSAPSGEGAMTSWGRPIIVDNRFPSTTAADAKFVMLANLKRHAVIGDRSGIAVKILDQGVVNTGGTAHDLAQTGDSALRVIKRTAFTTVLPNGIGWLLAGPAS